MTAYPEAIEVEEETAEAPMSGGVKIPLPEGFKVPGNKKDGEVFEVITKARKMGNHLMVDAIDGFELTPSAEMEEEMAEGEDEAATEAENVEMEEEEDGAGLMSALRSFRDNKIPMK